MDAWLEQWSAANNQQLHEKVYGNMSGNEHYTRHWNMPNTTTIRDQLKNLHMCKKKKTKIDVLELVDNFHLGWNGFSRTSSSLVIYTWKT